ncbi:hypothetical protein GCM10010451_66320 [Streptomyces virens]|uniref:Uncharacterized protein n=3 Tax=Bacillati TaxID=1783272 RepID=A0ABP6HE06_9ACTN
MTKRKLKLGSIALVVMLVGAFALVGLAAAEDDLDPIEDGHVAHDETIETDGPADVIVDLEADSEAAEAVKVTADVDGETETIEVAAGESESLEFDVDSWGSYDVEILTETEDDADDLVSIDVSTEADRVDGYEVESENDLELTNDTTDAFVDVEVDDEADDEVMVTLEVSDSETGDVLRFTSDEIEADETASLEVAVDDLEDVDEVDLTVYLETEDDADDLEVLDLGLSESTGYPIGSVDGSTEIPNWALIGVVLVGLGVVVLRQ